MTGSAHPDSDRIEPGAVIGVTPIIRSARGLSDELILRGVHQIVGIAHHHPTRIRAVGGARSISIFAISHRAVPRPVRISVRYKRPGICSQVENRTAIATPALLMESYFQPGSASTARNVMN